MISLEIKCPQLSKPEATAARNQNSIGDRMKKKTGSVGGQFSSDQANQQRLFHAAAKSDCAEDSSGSCGLVPMAV